MKYKDWYKEGVELGYLREYTTNLVDGLISNIVMFQMAFDKSVQDKLGKDGTEKMEKYGHQLYWLMIQRDMMDNEKYWKETDDV